MRTPYLVEHAARSGPPYCAAPDVLEGSDATAAPIVAVQVMQVHGIDYGT